MSGREQIAGKGRIVFIIALIVTGYVFYAAFKWFPMRVAHYEYQERVAEFLKFRGTQSGKNQCEELRQRVFREGRRLDIPVKRDKIRCIHSGNKWRIKLSYERQYTIPGIDTTFKYEVDESFTDY